MGCPNRKTSDAADKRTDLGDIRRHRGHEGLVSLRPNCRPPLSQKVMMNDGDAIRARFHSTTAPLVFSSHPQRELAFAGNHPSRPSCIQTIHKQNRKTAEHPAQTAVRRRYRQRNGKREFCHFSKPQTRKVSRLPTFEPHVSTRRRLSRLAHTRRRSSASRPTPRRPHTRCARSIRFADGHHVARSGGT